MNQTMNRTVNQTMDQHMNRTVNQQTKQTSDHMKLRLGKLSYLNNAPMYYRLAKNYHSHLAGRYEIVEGSPSYLNRCIRQKEIDLTVASSIEYARNLEHYLILPNLSISSDGPVKSVVLMSRVPMEKLDKQPLLLSSDSETSVALIKIILSRQGIEPVYIRGKVPVAENGNGTLSPDLAADFAALLVIGDRALQLCGQNTFPFVYDLGEEWKRMTGLPFVFALWMVRQEAYDRDRQLVFQLWQALLASRDYSLSHPEEFIASVKTQASLPRAVCLSYIQQNLRYELSSRYQEGLKMYYRFLYELGEIPQPVQALRFMDLMKQWNSPFVS
ncbi:MAG: menaquinone biosynthesis protein [bacterium]